MADTRAPPAYDDVVRENPTSPSAPPLEEHGCESNVPYTPFSPRPNLEMEEEHHNPSRPQQGRAMGSRNAPGSQDNNNNNGDFIERYISYSIPHFLRMNIHPREGLQDPELDVEAAFGRSAVRQAQHAIEKRSRMQCISAWLWCLGVAQALVYIGLPLAMIGTGGVGYSFCPYLSHAIPLYLIVGGIFLGLLVVSRVLPSCCTCCRNRNTFNSRKSTGFAGCICVMECFFCIILVCCVLALVTGSYFVFHSKPDSSTDCSDQDCEYCSNTVYLLSVLYIGLQYFLFALSGCFLCLVHTCHRCYKTY